MAADGNQDAIPKPRAPVDRGLPVPPRRMVETSGFPFSASLDPSKTYYDNHEPSNQAYTESLPAGLLRGFAADQRVDR